MTLNHVSQFTPKAVAIHPDPAAWGEPPFDINISYNNNHNYIIFLQDIDHHVS